MYRHDKRTFNLPNKNYYSGGIIGSGVALGLTDNSSNAGLSITAIGSDRVLMTRTTAYGTIVGQSTTGRSDLPDQKAIGIVANASNSGIKCETDSQLKLCIKY